jgi:hypothetical protein
VFSNACGLALFNFEVVFEKFQTVNELEANEFSPILVHPLYCRSGNQNWFSSCRVHIFTDRKLLCALKMFSCIYSLIFVKKFPLLQELESNEFSPLPLFFSSYDREKEIIKIYLNQNKTEMKNFIKDKENVYTHLFCVDFKRNFKIKKFNKFLYLAIKISFSRPMPLILEIDQ